MFVHFGVCSTFIQWCFILHKIIRSLDKNVWFKNELHFSYQWYIVSIMTVLLYKEGNSKKRKTIRVLVVTLDQKKRFTEQFMWTTNTPVIIRGTHKRYYNSSKSFKLSTLRNLVQSLVLLQGTQLSFSVGCSLKNLHFGVTFKHTILWQVQPEERTPWDDHLASATRHTSSTLWRQNPNKSDAATLKRRNANLVRKQSFNSYPKNFMRTRNYTTKRNKTPKNLREKSWRVDRKSEWKTVIWVSSQKR